MAQQPLVCQDLIIKTSRSHSRNTKICRTSLDRWSAHRRDLYLTKYNIQKRKTTMPPEEFKPTVLAVERPQTLLRRRGHWDRRKIVNTLRYFTLFIWMESKVGDDGPNGPYRLKARMRWRRRQIIQFGRHYCWALW